MIRLERRHSMPRFLKFGVPFLSIMAALVAGGLLLLASGVNPIEVYDAMLSGAFGGRYGLSETLVKTIPLILVGLGVSVAFRMQLWNIGGEGQIYMGAIFATWVTLYGLPDSPGIVMIPAMVVAGLLGGAVWGFIPGFLRARLGANETITSLLLNYVALQIAAYLEHGPWRDPQAYGFPGTPTFPDASYLPNWGNTRVHLGLVFGLVAALVVWTVIRRTRWGYEISVIGQNERVARYAGMPTKRTIITVMMVSGALCGLAGMSEVTGIGHQLRTPISAGYGYTAIIIAWLGRLNPAGIIFVAFALAALLVGGDQLQTTMGLPSAIGPMLQGTILFFLIGGEVLTRYRIVWRTPTPTKELEGASRG